MVLNQDNIDFLKAKYTELEIEENSIKRYSSIAEEYELLVHGAAMRIMPSSVLSLTGKDVVDFVHRISTNDVKSLGENTKITTLFTNEKGRVIDRTIYVRLAERSLIVGHYSERARLARWIDKYIIMEDIKLADETDGYKVFEVLGPQADSYLTMICGKCIDILDYNKVIDILLENISIRILRIKELNGNDKFLIITKSENFSTVINNFLDQKSVFDFGLVGDESYNLYRIEKGIPIVPKELNDNYNPHEANLLEDISFTKGCYIGQEVIARLDTYDKVQRQLKNFVINDAFQFNGEELPVINEHNEEIGSITSIAKSIKNENLIGLGYLRKKYDNHSTAKILSDDVVIDVSIKDIGAK